MKRLGAKTPPSPPEANVAEVTIGFSTMIPTKVRANESVSIVSFGFNKRAFILWYPSPYN